MKAWYVYPRVDPGSYRILVFAKTGGKAIRAAANQVGLEFLDMNVRRCGGYDYFAKRLSGADPGSKTTFVFMDNGDCLAAGIPPYYENRDFS